MNQKTFSLVAGAIFLAVGFLHVARILFSWQAQIGAWEIPLWVSWPGAAVELYLGFQGVRYGVKNSTA